MTQIPNNIERHTLGSARLPYAGLVSIVHCSSLVSTILHNTALGK